MYFRCRLVKPSQVKMRGGKNFTVCLLLLNQGGRWRVDRKGDGDGDGEGDVDGEGDRECKKEVDGDCGEGDS